MSLDPSTRITRTDAGVAELSKAANGLSLGQRKLLTYLDTSQLAGDVMGTYSLEPQKFERDLAKLQELRLVQVHGGSTRQAPPPPTIGPAVVLGGRRQNSPLPWIAAVVVLGAIAAAYLAMKPAAPAKPDALASTAPPVPAEAAPATAPAAAAVPAAMPAVPAPAAAAASSNVLPVAATMLGDSKDAKKPEAREGRAEPAPEPRPEVRLSPADTARLQGSAGNAAAASPPAAAPTQAAAAVAAPPARSTPPVIAEPTLVAVTSVALPAAPPAATPPVQVAAAAPSAAEARPAPKPVVADLTPLSREQPGFPREAISAGVSKGTVKARISVDAAGKVTGVTIVEANPRRVFDRAVTTSLAQWTFTPGAANRSTEVDINFNRD